ncbi:MAG: cytochrome c1 [Pseudomonadota bacterium]
MRLRHTLFGAALATALCLGGTTGGLAAGGDAYINHQEWSFAGPFGRFDKAQLQRGYKVYREICSACHGLSLVPFRALGENGALGFTEDEIKAIAAEYTIEDGPDDFGDMFEREGLPRDWHPSPFPNEQAARAANNNAYPVDLSLIAKARAAASGFPWFLFEIFTQYQEHGPDYVYSLLTGYQDPPEGLEVSDALYYNVSFLGGNALAMGPPLDEEIVEYTDGTPMTVDQYARDVSAFLMWAAEPKLEERKQTGLVVMIFLVAFAFLMYYSKRKLWSEIEH